MQVGRRPGAQPRGLSPDDLEDDYSDIVDSQLSRGCADHHTNSPVRTSSYCRRTDFFAVLHHGALQRPREAQHSLARCADFRLAVATQSPLLRAENTYPLGVLWDSSRDRALQLLGDVCVGPPLEQVFLKVLPGPSSARVGDEVSATCVAEMTQLRRTATHEQSRSRQAACLL
jgi:hypothetical protein